MSTRDAWLPFAVTKWPDTELPMYVTEGTDEGLITDPPGFPTAELCQRGLAQLRQHRYVLPDDILTLVRMAATSVG